MILCKTRSDPKYLLLFDVPRLLLWMWLEVLLQYGRRLVSNGVWEWWVPKSVILDEAWWIDLWDNFWEANVKVQILRSGADKCRAHNLWKPSMCKLDWGEGYSSYVGGFTTIEIRLWFCVRPDLIWSIFWIPYSIWLGVELLIYMWY